jgi:hypothetical protein
MTCIVYQVCHRFVAFCPCLHVASKQARTLLHAQMCTKLGRCSLAAPCCPSPLSRLLQGLGFASAIIDSELAPHRPPGTLPKARRAALARAAGHFQLLFQRRGPRRGQEPPRLRLRHRLWLGPFRALSRVLPQGFVLLACYGFAGS